MAENKKTIVVYADWIHKFEELEDDEAGRLIKHFFRYVNDLNPEYPDRTTKLMFIDIKNTLKRDLEKWSEKAPKRIEKARIAGLASAEARKLKKELNSTNELKKELNSTNSTVNDSVSVSVSVSDNVKKKRIVNKFTPPPLEEVIFYFTENDYSKELAEKAFKYYETGNWKDGKGNQVKNWKQKMQSVWFKEENKTIVKPKFISPA